MAVKCPTLNHAAWLFGQMVWSLNAVRVRGRRLQGDKDLSSMMYDTASVPIS